MPLARDVLLGSLPVAPAQSGGSVAERRVVETAGGGPGATVSRRSMSIRTCRAFAATSAQCSRTSSDRPIAP